MPDTPICIGVDPAPSSKGHAVVFIEGDQYTITQRVTHSCLRSKINEWKDKSAILIGWDAPLTGPRDPDDEKAGENNKGDFTKRPIESCWKSPKDGGPPKGISVQGYASCQHWTISRNLLGLPRVGRFDKAEELPFKLLTSRPKNWDGQHVVEVHPALAMWLWISCAHKHEIIDYRYKGNSSKELSSKKIRENRKSIVELLFQAWKREEKLLPLLRSLEEQNAKKNCEESPDVLDATVAAVLVYLWVKDKDEAIVTLLGDGEKGSFLLPNLPYLPKP